MIVNVLNTKNRQNLHMLGVYVYEVCFNSAYSTYRSIYTTLSYRITICQYSTTKKQYIQRVWYMREKERFVGFYVFSCLFSLLFLFFFFFFSFVRSLRSLVHSDSHRLAVYINHALFIFVCIVSGRVPVNLCETTEKATATTITTTKDHKWRMAAQFIITEDRNKHTYINTNTRKRENTKNK